MFIDKVLNFLFPPLCGICLKKDKDWICDECLNKLKSNHLKIKYININKNKINNKIKSQNIHKVYYLFEYKDLIRKKIIDYKFNDKSYLYKTFSNIILKNKKVCNLLNSYDIIIPVPMFEKKKSKRGYNQTELIARELSKKLNINYNNNILLKIKENKTQSQLNYTERKQNVIDVYKVNQREFENIKDKNEKILLENKKIILFDDIYTTGFTVKECIKELENYSLKNVDVFVLAKGKIENRIER